MILSIKNVCIAIFPVDATIRRAGQTFETTDKRFQEIVRFHQPFWRWSKVCQWDASPSPRFPRCACTKSSPPLKLVVYDVKIGKVHDYLTTWTLWPGIEHWDLWLGPHLLTLENGNIAFHISGLSPPLPLVASDQFFHHQSSWSHRPTRQAASEHFKMLIETISRSWYFFIPPSDYPKL